MLPKTAEVVVIGGGLIGSSIAYHLAEKNADVVLIEKKGVASNTSGACDGMVFLQTKKPGIHLTLALESAKMFRDLINVFGIDIEYRNNGGMMVIESEEDLEAIKDFVQKQQKLGLDVCILDKGEAIKKEPALSDTILGATFSPIDAQVHPIFLNHAFIDSARTLGAKVFTHTEVTGIKLASSGVESIVTDRGEIKTTTVINAAGIYAPEIGKMVGLDIPIKPRRGQVLITEEVPKLFNSIIISANTIAVKYGSNPQKPTRGGVGVEQTESGNILIGATRELVGFNKETTYEGMNEIASHILEFIPKLRGINVIRTFAGLRPYTPDGLPILGKVDRVKGFVMAAGHEGDGVSLSPITGALIAELIEKDKTNPPLDEFRLERFPI